MFRALSDSSDLVLMSAVQLKLICFDVAMLVLVTQPLELHYFSSLFQYGVSSIF